MLPIILCAISYSSMGQIMYQTRYKSAIVLEGFGLSPILSANYERAFIRNHKSFWTGRVGFGYLPGMKNPPPDFAGGNGVSFPVAVSYNAFLNDLSREKRTRYLNTFPRRYTFEWFLETGLGLTHVAYFQEKDRQFLFTNIGLRTQLKIDIPPKPRVVFLKISLNPVYNNNKFSLLYRSEGGAVRFYGGFALGTSI